MKIGFKTSQTDVDWPTLLATWELADETPAHDSRWLFDHFVSLADGRERHPVHRVLLLVPAGSEPEHKPPTGNVVHGRA